MQISGSQSCSMGYGYTQLKTDPSSNETTQTDNQETAALSTIQGQANAQNPLAEYVNSIESEEGEAIRFSLQNLSIEGQSALKEQLEAFKPEADSLSQEEREEGFMQILSDVFGQYGEDTGSSSALLSTYA